MKRLIVSTLCYTLSAHYAFAQNFEPVAERAQQYSNNQTNQNGYQQPLEVRYSSDESNADKKEATNRVVYNDLHGSDLKF